jgi:hypothetical protein
MGHVPVRRWLTWVAFLCVLATGHAQPPSAPPSGPAHPEDSQPVNQAEMHVLPVPTPEYSSGYYPTLPDPNAGYLSGASDVIGAQAQFMTAKKQADLMEQQVEQAKIDTRRKNVDEYLYERNVLPTAEDDRERARMESLRRSRNNPPLNEIWSGKALNELLLGIQQQLALKVLGPDVPLNPDTVHHINVTSGSAPGSTGLLRNQGKISWPLVLRDDDYADLRKKINQLVADAYQQASAGAVSDDIVEGLIGSTRKLQAALKGNINNVTPDDYIRGKRFIHELENTAKQLQDPNVTKYVSGRWAARGENVADLAKEMTQLGLRFAPALQGDEPAYVALHSAFVQYFDAPAVARRWDTMSK